MSYRKMSLMEVIHRMAHRSDAMSIDEQAAGLNISAKNFYNMLNPHAESFHYRISMLVPHMLMLSDRSPLDYLASQMDCVVLPVPKAPAGMGDVQVEINRTVKECGDVLQELGRAMEDGKITLDEMKRIEQEVFELMPQLMALLRSAQQVAEG